MARRRRDSKGHYFLYRVDPTARPSLICTPLTPRPMMREVKPLSDRQWKMVVEQLKQGPTPEMVRGVERALELAKDIEEVDYNEYMAQYRKKGTG